VEQIRGEPELELRGVQRLLSATRRATWMNSRWQVFSLAHRDLKMD